MRLSRPIIFFDLETTGLSTTKDKIIEISVTKMFPNDSPVTKTRRLNPQMVISDGAIKAHGITNEDLQDCDTFEEVAGSLHDFFKGCDLAGYNLMRFDIPLLRERFLHCGLEFPEPDVKIIDVYRLVAKAIPRNLGDMYKFLTGNSSEGAHGAEFDNMMTLSVLDKMTEKRSYCLDPATILGITEENNTVEYLAELSNDILNNGVDFDNKIIVDEAGDYRFNFGTHRGEKVLDNFSYCKWIDANDFSLDTKQVIKRIWENNKSNK